jgi:hypothetical protein
MFRPVAKTLLRTAPLRAAPRASASTAVRAMSSSSSDKLSYSAIPKDYFGEYKEYSVIHTNRSLNLMSNPFQQVMRNLNDLLIETYNAEKVAIIPGYVKGAVWIGAIGFPLNLFLTIPPMILTLF